MSTVPLTTVDPAEVRVLGGAVEAIDVDESDGEAMHLLLSPGTRRWVLQGRLTEIVLDADDPGVTGEVDWLPVSERVRRFADAASGEVQLLLSDDVTVLARCGAMQAAIDVVPGSARPQPWQFVPRATATVGAGDLLTLLWSARWMPAGLDDETYPMPPMWMRLADDALTLHVDWTDFVPSRSTYRVVAAAQAGEATVAIPHSMLESFLRVVPTLDDDLEQLRFTVEVGELELDDETHEAMAVHGPGWRLTTRTMQPLRGRWAATVRDELARVDGEVLEDGPVQWVLDVDGVGVVVRLHHGHPDVARVSAQLVEGVDECLDLLRELGALNAASTGVRYWWADDAVYAAADVLCTALTTLHDAVRDVADAAATYAPMLAALGAQE